MEHVELKNNSGFQIFALKALEKTQYTSAEETLLRFSTVVAAAKYSKALEGTRRHQREIACIRDALEMITPGAKVLDLPCGTGRLVPFLSSLGYRVTAADSSPHMVRIARERFPNDCMTLVANVFATEFQDNAFEAVVCNRLFHHLRESENRRSALRELGRICSPEGIIVISFFCNYSIDAWRFHIKNALKTEKATDRIPISYKLFVQEIESEGLEIVNRLTVRKWVSPQWYLSLRKKPV